ncbi:MAG: TetR/AcrR family transcriptional regulator [Ktedonobacterales bacterium]|nr:TetR/AcrR family transcriptional regulator [Ktedonobacterales bacterium]
MVHDPIVEDGIASGARRERRDAAAHRQRILAVARDLFAHAGVAAVTMHQIARAAGIGQGTLYRRYANKGDLCRDLMHEHHERFIIELRAYVAEAYSAPALTKLTEVIERMLHFVNDSMALLETVVTTAILDMDCNEGSALTDGPPMRHEWFQAQQNLLEGLLREAVADGEIAPLDVAYTADLLLSAMNPLSLHYQQAERGYSLERIAAGLRHIFITGVHGPGATNPATAQQG